MNNFTFRNPTKLVFGKDSILELPKLLPSDAKILLTFGGGSVKRNGVYEAVISQLSGFQTVEFWGIEPNPKVETLRKAIALGKQEGVTFVLAVGGGSVLDASKLIVNAIPSERDAWDLVLHGADRSVQTLPLGTVLTIPATGSEMNRGAVISSEATHEKFGFYNEYPLFSILDPSYTYSLPDYQIACGIADSFIHVVEQYLTRVGESPLMDRWAEGILLTLIEEADKIKAQPADYDARATFMLSATMALNGFISMGVTQDWATHRIGHEITALTGLTHGHTLVIVLPPSSESRLARGSMPSSCSMPPVSGVLPRVVRTNASLRLSTRRKHSSVRLVSRRVSRSVASEMTYAKRSSVASVSVAPSSVKIKTSTTKQ